MIYKATETDIPAVAEMAMLLWEGNTAKELSEEFAELVRSDKGAVFIAAAENKAIGFAQVQLRYDYVEGTGSSPVGYLEAVFIRQEYRKQGYARKLLCHCEEWAKEKGCTEFASDCELTNDQSLEFHLKVGFTEVNRVICFTKLLR